MTVNLFRVNVLVICVAVLQAAAPPKGGDPPVLDATANPEAYEIYAVSLAQRWYWPRWPRTESLLVLQETVTGVSCGEPRFRQTGEWAEVERDFQQQNTVQRLLQHALPTNFQYSFIRRSEIDADNALRQRQDSKSLLSGPGPIDYVAVSSVGFDRDRTKAMVSVHLRGSWSMEKWQLRDGKWQRAGTVCTVDY